MRFLGQASRDNSENPKAVTGIALTYKEKSGWECKDADIKAAVEKLCQVQNQKQLMLW